MNHFSYNLFSGIILPGLMILAISISACAGSEPFAESEKTEPDYASLEALYWERIESSRMNFVQADIDFMNGMIAHHAQALIMSRLAPENDASGTVQTLASRIINAQGDEIALMQKWLRDRGQPVPEVHIDGLVLMVYIEEDNEAMDHGNHHSGHNGGHQEHTGDSMAHHHNMPGMLTQGQLEELAASYGTPFNRRFLQFMIEHHKGAVIMVDDLFSVDGAALDAEIFELAAGIRAEQVTEIERMQLMLESID